MLDLANAYGAVPHLLILKALRFYYVPDKIIKIIVVYFAGCLWEVLFKAGDLKLAEV